MIYGQCNVAAIEARVNTYNYVTFAAIALTFLASSSAREVVALVSAQQPRLAVAKVGQVRCIAWAKIAIGVLLAVAINPCSGVDTARCHCEFSKLYPTLCVAIGLLWLSRSSKLHALAEAAGQIPTLATATAALDPNIPIAHAQVIPAPAGHSGDEAPLVGSK